MIYNTDIKRIFFLPATWLTGRLRESHLMILIVVLLFAPLIVTSFSVIAGYEKKIEAARNGQVGVVYLRQVWPFLKHLQQHRGLASAYLSGDTSFKSRMTEMEKTINSDIDAFSVVEREYGKVSVHGTLSGSEFLKSNWEELQKDVWALTPGESFRQHSALAEATIGLMNMIVDSSGLFLNADGTTFYLVSTIGGGIPPMTEWLGKMRAFGISLGKGKSISATERRTLTGFSALAGNSIQKIRDEMKISSQNNLYVQTKLANSLEETIKHVDDFLMFVETNIILLNTNTVNTADYYTYATNVIDMLFALYDADAAVLYRMQEDVIRDNRVREYEMLVMVVGMVAAGGYVLYGTYGVTARRHTENLFRI